jgi:hypothetical protein
LRLPRDPSELRPQIVRIVRESRVRAFEDFSQHDAEHVGDLEVSYELFPVIEASNGILDFKPALDDEDSFFFETVYHPADISNATAKV